MKKVNLKTATYIDVAIKVNEVIDVINALDDNYLESANQLERKRKKEEQNPKRMVRWHKVCSGRCIPAGEATGIYQGTYYCKGCAKAGIKEHDTYEEEE